MDIKLKDNNKLALSIFTQLEYIESTGTQYIDTGIVLTEKISFDLDYKLNTVDQRKWFFGSATAHDGKGIFITNYGNGLFVITDTSKREYTIGAKDTNRHFIEYRANFYVKIDTTTVNCVTNAFNSVNSCLIFGCRNGGTIDKQSQRIYRCTFYENNFIVADFIPARDDEGVVCLYEAVSNTFFYNQGTGDFIAGNTIDDSDMCLPAKLLSRTTTIYHQNTPKINGRKLLDRVLSVQETANNIVLSRVRINVGNVSGSLSELMRYSSLHGFNDSYEQQTKPRLVGTWTINSFCLEDQLNFAIERFDGLVINCDSSLIVNFDNVAVQGIDETKPNYNPAFITHLHRIGFVPNDQIIFGRGAFFTKAQASGLTMAQIYSGGNIAGVAFASKMIRGVSSITDTYGCVNSSYVNGQIEPKSYDLVTLEELKYFTGWVKLLEGRHGNDDDWASYYDNISPFSMASKLKYVNFPETCWFLGQCGLKDSTISMFRFPSLTVVDVTSSRQGNIFESSTTQLYVGIGDKYKDSRVYEEYRSSTKWSNLISRVHSWYDYTTPQLSYDGTSVTITVQRTSDIYYTTDGTIPTIDSSKYTSPFVWDGTGCVKAMAIDTSIVVGDISYSDDFYATATQDPVISYTNSQITISAESNATVYYTLDGTHPTLDSSVYSGQISTQGMGDFINVRCFARMNGKNDSEIVGKICVIDDTKWGTDGDDSYFAVQCIDSTKPNYNPAVCIILDNHNKLTDRCYGGGGYISKTDAVNISNFGGTGYNSWFVGKINVSSALLSGEYSFNEFDEFRFFSGITHVTDYLFRGCTSLESIIFPNSVTHIDSNSPFQNCTSLHNVILNNGLVYIGDCAFSNTGYIEELIIPDTVTTVGYEAFSSARVKKVVLGSSVTELSTAAFMRNSTLTEFVINNNILTNLGRTTFYSCGSLKITEIPKSVTLLKHETFYGCNFDYLHLTSPSLVSVQDNTVFTGSYKIYVGDGSSATHDDAILADYLADTNWTTYSSRLDTWYNYLHPSV